MRRAVVAGGVALALGACGLGARDAHADRVMHAGEKLLAAPSVHATVEATVRLVKSDKLLAAVAPKLAPEHVKAVDAVINGRDGTAAIGTNSANGKPVIVFADNAIYQRIALKTTGLRVVPSNFDALAAAMTTQLLPAPVTTSTTAPVSKLRRRVQIVREWAVFDYAAVEDHDKTKHAGSLAINPVDILRLSRGVLSGSIERRAGNRYDANVSRDKAERDLTEDARKVLDKEFTANAISRTVFPAKFWLDESGALTRMQVTLRQQLTSVDRADLTITLDLRPLAEPASVAKPGRRGTVQVHTLRELVTTVTGA